MESAGQDTSCPPGEVRDHAGAEALGDEVAIRREAPRTAGGALRGGGARELGDLRDLRWPVVLERRVGARLVLRAAGAPGSDSREKDRGSEAEARPVGYHEARHLPDFGAESTAASEPGRETRRREMTSMTPRTDSATWMARSRCARSAMPPLRITSP